MFSVGARYQWVTISYLVGFFVPFPFWLAYRYTKIEFFRYINLSIILWYMGWLFVGINASIMVYFVIGIGARKSLLANYLYTADKYWQNFICANITRISSSSTTTLCLQL